MSTPDPAQARWSTPISLIRLTGADTSRFLHGPSSQAIELAPSGAIASAALCACPKRMCSS